MEIQVRRSTPKCKLLEKRFGGKWKYRGFVGWDCDDGRYACYISNGCDEFDNPYPGPFRVCVYGNNETHHFHWYELEGE